MSASTTGDLAPAAPPRSSVVDGELTTRESVSFEVRPLDGPGTMGPTVLSERSTPALDEVLAYLFAHPEVDRLRIECSINPKTMSSSPDARWPVGLALQIARWLVSRRLDCSRLEAVGKLDETLVGAGERVRFFVGKTPTEPGAAGVSAPEAAPGAPQRESRVDVCTSLQ